MSHARTKKRGHILKVKDLKEEDSGTYKCAGKRKKNFSNPSVLFVGGLFVLYDKNRNNSVCIFMTTIIITINSWNDFYQPYCIIVTKALTILIMYSTTANQALTP